MTSCDDDDDDATFHHNSLTACHNLEKLKRLPRYFGTGQRVQLGSYNLVLANG